MYSTHVPRIASAFEVEPLEVFPSLVKFVLATIQQQFSTVPVILEEWEKLGTDAPSMWGMKRDGYQWLSSVHWKSVAMTLHRAQRENDRVLAIDALVEIPGINVVKAAFIAQCVGLKTACLDTQNLQLHQIDNIEAFRIRSNNRAATRLAKINAYLELCDGIDHCASFWDSWCEVIAAQYPKHYPLGSMDVSSQHVELILGKLTPAKPPF